MASLHPPEQPYDWGADRRPLLDRVSDYTEAPKPDGLLLGALVALVLAIAVMVLGFLVIYFTLAV